MIESDFMAAIIANPADDSLRLVFSDWLEEHGEPERCEFIRVQCELARLPDCQIEDIPGKCGMYPMEPCEVCQRRLTLRRRERELLVGGRDYDWFFPRGMFQQLCEWEYRRGFVSRATCFAADWLTYGPAILKVQPVESVVISDLRPWNAGNHRWGWASPGELFGEAPWVLTQEWYDLLPPSDNGLPANHWRRWYRSEGIAFASLSYAVLRWARQEAT